MKLHAYMDPANVFFIKIDRHHDRNGVIERIMKEHSAEIRIDEVDLMKQENSYILLFFHMGIRQLKPLASLNSGDVAWLQTRSKKFGRIRTKKFLEYIK